MKLYIYPYTSGSESAKLLGQRLSALRLKLSNSTYVHDPKNNLIINWGNSSCPYTENVLNPAAAIRQTVDKLKFFRLMMQAGLTGYLPPYWTHPDDIPSEAYPVLCRTTTTGCDGAGIVIALKRSEIVPAPLYTSVIGVSKEYRVTLFRDEVTDIQTKLPRQGQNAHPTIRTYANGWGFQRVAVDETVKSKIVEAAKAALRVSKLDFAGVDIIYSNGRAYVLEVNTAMGLEGQALDRFAKAVEAYAASLEPPSPVSALEGASPDNSDPIEAWLDQAPVSAAGGVDWQTVIIKMVARLS